jgi:hypothetical protein
VLRHLAREYAILHSLSPRLREQQRNSLSRDCAVPASYADDVELCNATEIKGISIVGFGASQQDLGEGHDLFEFRQEVVEDHLGLGEGTG